MRYKNFFSRLLRFSIRKLSSWRQFWINCIWKIKKLAYADQLTVGGDVSCYVPVRCDGNGYVKIGNGTMLGFPLAPRIGNGEMLIQARKAEANINIGDNVHFSNNVSIVAEEKIIIGDKCLIGDLVLIIDSDFHEVDPIKRHDGAGKSKPVHIGKNVWLGSRVIVKKGANIGENSIIAANSVVSGTIPPNCIVGGNPAVIIKHLYPIQTI